MDTHVKHDDFERIYFEELYLNNKGNSLAMSRESGLSRATVFRKIVKYGLRSEVNFRRRQESESLKRLSHGKA